MKRTRDKLLRRQLQRLLRGNSGGTLTLWLTNGARVTLLHPNDIRFDHATFEVATLRGRGAIALSEIQAIEVKSNS